MWYLSIFRYTSILLSQEFVWKIILTSSSVYPEDCPLLGASHPVTRLRLNIHVHILSLICCNLTGFDLCLKNKFWLLSQLFIYVGLKCVIAWCQVILWILQMRYQQLNKHCVIKLHAWIPWESNTNAYLFNHVTIQLLEFAIECVTQ